MITGDQIREARKRLGWTGRQLAEAANLSSRTVIRAEQSRDGTDLAINTVIRLRATFQAANLDGEADGVLGGKAITGMQIAGARKLLGLRPSRLAQKAQLPTETVKHAETCYSQEAMPLIVRVTLYTILEAAGVVFESNGQPRVRLALSKVGLTATSSSKVNSPIDRK